MKKQLNILNDHPIIKDGKYILYWMQDSQRTLYNFGLEYAVKQSKELQKPLLVFFYLIPNYPEANRRHFYFMLQGLQDVKKNLEDRKIDFRLVLGNRDKIVTDIFALATDAACLVLDKGYLKFQKKIKKELSSLLSCQVIEAESNIIVPIEKASSKEEYSAATLRKKINRVISEYVEIFDYSGTPFIENKSILISNDITEKLLNIDDFINSLNIDNSVDKSLYFNGGEEQALKKLDFFIRSVLKNYPDKRSDPGADMTSHLSPYLHFGQISPLYIYHKITETENPSASTFLEELIIRRELAYNFVYYNDNYDRWEGITYPWAYTTLKEHEKDPRPFLYSLEELEQFRTHDEYWNAAQKEMVFTGFMSSYMRMYWCKKILEWSPTPEEAYKRTLYLNNKYFLDGRDPNSYAGVAWCFGKHDRAWPERSIFGKIRYMNFQGLKRKFNMAEYILRVNKLHQR